MIGKVIGGALGFLTFGPLGLVVGGVAGHFFDVGRGQIGMSFNPGQKEEIEEAFFLALFPCLGYLAKADGHVSEEEIASAQEMMRRMGLDEAQRQSAIELFNRGKSGASAPTEALDAFTEACGNHREAKQMFLVYLISLALADQRLVESEERVLSEIAERIGYSSFAFNQLIGMVRAQMAFRERHDSNSGYSYYQQQHQRGGQSPYESRDRLATAYEALGVDASISDTDLKRAYRKLMSENHPDKLAGQGVPEDAIKLATERSQEIQSAYDLIKKSRK